MNDRPQLSSGSTPRVRPSPAAPCGAVLSLLAAPLLALLWVYRRFVSPALPPACRYYPSCAQYAEEALRLHGPFGGTWLAVRRLLRCHPFCEGGPDPVPPRAPLPRSA